MSPQVCGGAPGHEGVGDERGDHRLAGHAAGHLRARSLRDVPRLVRVLQHLPEVLRPCARRPPLLQAQEQVSEHSHQQQFFVFIMP